MPDLEKTIKGLRCHSEPKFGPDEYFCETCPYDEATCGLDVPNDALSLLKAQQAKLMTLEDIMEIYNARDCHLWPYDTAPYIFVEEHPNIYTYHGSWTAWREIMTILHDGIFVHTRNTYGKTWRCWTFHPTDGQRKAVKWDE